MAKGDGLRGLIRDRIPTEWAIILKKHRVYKLYTDAIYEHNIHKSRRYKFWLGENVLKLKRVLNSTFLLAVCMQKLSTPEHPQAFWEQLDVEINELINNFK